MIKETHNIWTRGCSTEWNRGQTGYKQIYFFLVRMLTNFSENKIQTQNIWTTRGCFIKWNGGQTGDKQRYFFFNSDDN